MATHNAIPTLGSTSAPTNVIKPSGKLWSPSAKATINPVLFNLAFSTNCSSSAVELSPSCYAEQHDVLSNSLFLSLLFNSFSFASLQSQSQPISPFTIVS